ncbi:Putative helicase mov-10-B.1 [Anthophora plagiata]
MANNKNSFIGQSTHCTSFGVCKQILFRDCKAPAALHEALKHHLIEHPKDSNLCRNYIKLLKSLPNIKKIESKYYLTLFKILLYMEYHELEVNIAKHSLKNQTVKQASDTLVITVPTLNEDNSCINVCDMVRLYLLSKKRTYYGKIKDIVKENVYVSLFNMSQISELSNCIVNVYFIPSSWTIKCCHYVLFIMSKYNLVSLVYPKIDRNLYFYSKSVSEWINESVAVNPEQQVAVISILNNSAYPAPYILFGPPGTGKTTTLVESICQIRKHDKSKHILVCASSNTAADEIAKRLLLILPSKDIFRMYAASKIVDNIDETINPSSNFVNNMVLYLPKDIFILKKIVITTLTSCARLVKLNLRSDHFSYVFIDEASQSIELESLIPLTLVVSQNERNEGTMHAQVVVAGDPHQLGPIITCKRITHLLGTSFLERLMECEPYKKSDGYNSRYITKLIRNYRSKEAILHIPNELFYDNELLCCSDSNINNVTSNWSILSNSTFPIIFLAVKGNERRMTNHSVYNEKEVTVITECTKKLMHAKLGTRKIKQNDIGIIAPFKEQTVRIEESLNMHKLKNITVGTVERFQGQEKEIILLSTVRSKSFEHDGKEHLGFLSNPKRFNVALTRAKNLLIIVGNPSILCKDRYWNALWEYCKENNACNTDENI